MIDRTEVIRRAVARVKDAINQAPGNTDHAGLCRMIETAIRDEFTLPDHWQPIKRRDGRWSIRNSITGDDHTAKAGRAGTGKRVIIYKSQSSARVVADKLNAEIVR